MALDNFARGAEVGVGGLLGATIGEHDLSLRLVQAGHAVSTRSFISTLPKGIMHVSVVPFAIKVARRRNYCRAASHIATSAVDIAPS